MRPRKKRKLVKQKATELPNTSSPPPLLPPPAPRKKTAMEKHSAKKASLLASHIAAKTMFAQSDKVKQLEEKIASLQEQLQAQEQVAFAIVAS